MWTDKHILQSERNQMVKTTSCMILLHEIPVQGRPAEAEIRLEVTGAADKKRRGWILARESFLVGGCAPMMIV